MFCITYIGSRRTQLLTYGTRGFGTCLAIRRFHYWIYGRDFKLITDHKPLLWLFSPDKHIAPYASGRIQRWSLLFQSYTFRLLHTSGKLLVVVADTIPVPGEWVCLVEKLESGCVTAETIASETSKVTDTVGRFCHVNTAVEFRPGFMARLSTLRACHFILRGFLRLSLQDTILQDTMTIPIPGKKCRKFRLICRIHIY